MDKIIFVIGTTKGGGAEKRAILISKLLKDNFDTKVFAFYGENDGDIDTVYKSCYSLYKETKRSDRIKALREYLIKEKPRYVFSFIPFINFFTTRALKTKELSNVKHIVGVVNIKTIFISQLLFKYSIRHADAVYYQCKDQQEAIKCKCFSFVLANPITVPLYKEKNTHLKMMSIGRLEDQKDFSFMINSFKKISESMPEATLDIYGDGDLKEELNRIIIENSLTNKVKLNSYRNDIDSVFETHDIFLFTPKFEGFPNSLAEAMAHNLLCFSTEFKTGCKDLIINSKTGYSCKKDMDEFATLVVDELKDAKKNVEVSANGYNHVKSLCDIKSYSKSLTEILSHL